MIYLILGVELRAHNITTESVVVCCRNCAPACSADLHEAPYGTFIFQSLHSFLSIGPSSSDIRLLHSTLLFPVLLPRQLLLFFHLYRRHKFKQLLLCQTKAQDLYPQKTSFSLTPSPLLLPPLKRRSNSTISRLPPPPPFNPSPEPNRRPIPPKNHSLKNNITPHNQQPNPTLPNIVRFRLRPRARPRISKVFPGRMNHQTDQQEGSHDS